MIRFQYHVFTIAAIFLSFTLGLFIGLSLGGGQITKQQAQVIDNLKSEVTNYRAEIKSLKKEKDEMKTLLSKWENKGEKINDALTYHANFSFDEYVILGKESFVENTTKIMSNLGFNVTPIKVGKDIEGKDLKNQFLRTEKSKKFITHEENERIINTLKDSKVSYLILESNFVETDYGDNINKLILLESIFGIEELIYEEIDGELEV